MLAQFDRSNAPGLSVAVFRKGEIAYSNAVGMADLEHGVRLTPDSVFDIASMSKQFTAAAVVLLQQQGHLSLDDDARKYIPELHADGRVISIRQLLQHTSGIRDYLDLMDLAGQRPEDTVVSQSDVVNVIAAQKELNFAPGEAFRYENSSYALMATIVKRVSGKSLREFAAENMFGPLGMRATRFRDDHTEVIPNRACGYEPREGGWSSVTPVYDEVGDGGIWTTTADLAKWDANFYKPVILGKEGLRTMVTQAVLNNGLKMSYALGLFIGTHEGREMVSHGGVDPGYRAEMLRFPEQALTVAVLANNPAYDVSGLATRIADVYLPALPKPTDPTGVAKRAAVTPLGDLLGKYLDVTTGRVREIAEIDGTIVLRSRAKDYPLILTSGLRFEDPSDGAVISFDIGAGGVRRMVMSSHGQMPSTSKHLPKVPPAFHVSDYVGTYWSPELKAEWELRQVGDALALSRPHYSEAVLTPLDRDEFMAQPGLIRFTRTNGNRVAALWITNVRDSDIRFGKLASKPQ